MIIVLIMVFTILYLSVGGWLKDQWYEEIFENPIYKPLFVLFWPIPFVFIALWLGFGSWVKDVVDYYKEKKERKNGS